MNARSTSDNNQDHVQDAARFDYHLKEAEHLKESEVPASSTPEVAQSLSLLHKHLNTESEQIQRKRIIAGTIAGGILVSVILLRIAGELIREYTRQKQDGENVQEVEWKNEKRRAAEKLVRPASERKDASESDDELPDEYASMH